MPRFSPITLLTSAILIVFFINPVFGSPVGTSTFFSNPANLFTRDAVCNCQQKRSSSTFCPCQTNDDCAYKPTRCYAVCCCATEIFVPPFSTIISGTCCRALVGPCAPPTTGKRVETAEVDGGEKLYDEPFVKLDGMPEWNKVLNRWELNTTTSANNTKSLDTRTAFVSEGSSEPTVNLVFKIDLSGPTSLESSSDLVDTTASLDNTTTDLDIRETNRICTCEEKRLKNSWCPCGNDNDCQRLSACSGISCRQTEVFMPPNSAIQSGTCYRAALCSGFNIGDAADFGAGARDDVIKPYDGPLVRFNGTPQWNSSMGRWELLDEGVFESD